ncbi:unnamed protein product [Urochloa humidicola]
MATTGGSRARALSSFSCEPLLLLRPLRCMSSLVDSRRQRRREELAGVAPCGGSWPRTLTDAVAELVSRGLNSSLIWGAQTPGRWGRQSSGGRSRSAWSSWAAAGGWKQRTGCTPVSAPLGIEVAWTFQPITACGSGMPTWRGGVCGTLHASLPITSTKEDAMAAASLTAGTQQWCGSQLAGLVGRKRANMNPWASPSITRGCVVYTCNLQLEFSTSRTIYTSWLLCVTCLGLVGLLFDEMPRPVTIPTMPHEKTDRHSVFQ